MECGDKTEISSRVCPGGEKTELWRIAGSAEESLGKAIGRTFGKQSSSIYFLVAPAWWDSSCPAARHSRLALTLSERELISRRHYGTSIGRSIAKLLGRSPSTVSREMLDGSVFAR